MSYPKLPNLQGLTELIELYVQLKYDHDAHGVDAILANTETR